MTDPSQPDHLQDPKPEGDDQAKKETAIRSEEGIDTAAELPTIPPEQSTIPPELAMNPPGSVPDSDNLPNSDDFPTVPVDAQEQTEVVLKKDFVPGYDLLGELGRGGMGVVYQARDQKLKRLVAVKMILGGVHASQEDMQRFQTEAEAVAKLQHPNIVQIFEVGEYQGNPYISLEYQQGGGLDQKIAGKPQNIEESAKLIETLSRAMEVAHQQEIIHRDLKPANILLSSEGEPKITDFGLAKRMDDDSNQTKTGAVMGTPSYMPPEQASSSIETLGPAADTYALGAILYHLLTGRPPFQSETQLDTLMQVISDDPVPPSRLNSNVPADLETICLKCLQKDIKRRYTTAAALAEDLRRFQTGEPIAARPVSAMERGWKWARRRPAVAGMIGVSALALISLITGGLWYNAQLQDSLTMAENRREEAQEQRELAEKQRKVAEKQKEAADRNFKLARDAVDELTTVSQDELFNLPQMEPVRRALLEKAKAFYTTFVEQSAGDPELLYKLGKAHERLGTIVRHLGDPAAAAAEYERSRLAFSQLLNDHKHVPLYALDLAHSFNNLGITLSDLGKNEEAIQLYEKEILILEKLSKGHPNEPDYAASLAVSYNNLAGSLSDLGKTDEAIEFYSKAILIREQLVKDHPDLPAYAIRLTRAYNNLGEALYESGKTNEALELHNKTIPTIELLVKDHPGVPDYPASLSDSYHALGRTLAGLGQLNEAVNAYHKAIAVREQLVEDQPAMPEYQESLILLYVMIGSTMRQLGDKDEAIGFLSKAINAGQILVQDHPGVPGYAKALGGAYMSIGIAFHGSGQLVEAIDQYNKAILVITKLVKDHPDIPEYVSLLLKSNFNCGMALQGRRQFSDATRHYQTSLQLVDSLQTNGPFYQNQARKTQQIIAQRLDVCRMAKRALGDQDFVLAQPPAMAARLLYLKGQVQLDEKKHAAAVKTANRSAELQFPDDQKPALARNFYSTACLLSLASDAVTRDGSLTTVDRKTLEVQYAARAMELLMKAHETGWFDDAANVIHLKKTDTDLDPLRQRDDFKKFVETLKTD